jgi:hypothetical protein
VRQTLGMQGLIGQYHFFHDPSAWFALSAGLCAMSNHGAEVVIDANFALAARNIEGVDVLPTMGANVYDILKRDTLVITKAGVEALEARLK